MHPRPSPLKVQAFLCFQTSHVTRMTRELKPLRNSLGMTAEALHHQGPNLLEEVALGIISSLSILRTDSHTSLVRTQEERIWWMVSSWSQEWQTLWWGRPCLAKRSEVQQQLLMASQTKNLQLEGAQLFQTRFQWVNLMATLSNFKFFKLYVNLLNTFK